MQQKYSVVTDLRGRIKEATLDEGKRKELQVGSGGLGWAWLCMTAPVVAPVATPASGATSVGM